MINLVGLAGIRHKNDKMAAVCTCIVDLALALGLTCLHWISSSLSHLPLEELVYIPNFQGRCFTNLEMWQPPMKVFSLHEILSISHPVPTVESQQLIKMYVHDT